MQFLPLLHAAFKLWSGHTFVQENEGVAPGGVEVEFDAVEDGAWAMIGVEHARGLVRSSLYPWPTTGPRHFRAQVHRTAARH